MGPPGVISTGGGAFLSEKNRELINRLGVSVWLKADLEILWNRVRHKNTRPLLRTADPKRTLSDLLAARIPHYQKAQIVVEAEPGLSVQGMARKVVTHLREVDGLIEEVKDA